MVVRFARAFAIVAALSCAAHAETEPLAMEDRLALLERGFRDLEARGQANSFAVEQLTQALRETRAVVQNNADVIERIVARLARGDDPIVALEVENLWRRLRALEEELGAMIEASPAVVTE